MVSMYITNFVKYQDAKKIFLQVLLKKMFEK